MHPLSLCDVQARTAVLAIGILSTLYYAVQIVAWIINAGLIMDKMGMNEYDIILIGIILMTIASVLLASGAKLRNRVLLLPYMIIATLTTLSYMIGVVVAGFLLIPNPNLTSASIGIFFVALLHFVVMGWIIWVIVIYYIDLSKAEGYDDLKSPYRGPESGEPTDHGGKQINHQNPTVVSEFIKRFK